MVIQTRTETKVNPLDAAMTKAQVVRRKFKSGLPRRIEDRDLSKMEALAKTMELLDRFRGEMARAGLRENDVKAGLVYSEGQFTHTKVLPAPGQVAAFCEEIMRLQRPRFLGVIFLQVDHETTDKPEKRNTIFVWPFFADRDSQKLLLAARKRQQEGGFKGTAN